MEDTWVDKTLLVLLIIVFGLTVLKLTGSLTWGWVWIISPIWIPIALTTLGLILVWFFGFCVYFIIGEKSKNNSK